MSFKSHVKSPARAFDHLYDPCHKSNKNSIHKLNFKALLQTAPMHIIPCYSSMFTDLMTSRRNFYFPQQNSLPINDDIRPMICDRAMNTNHFVFAPLIAQREENFKTDISYHPPLFTKSFRSVECQTKYRESSAQTDPWLPDAFIRDGEIEIPDVFYVNCEIDPGLREIENVERARIQREWENQLMKMTRGEFLREVEVLKAFEWESFLRREREMNENQKNRLEQVEKIIEERQEMNQKYKEMMTENVKKRNDAEVEKKKSQMKITCERKLRKMMVKNNVEIDEFKPRKIENSFVEKLERKNYFKALKNTKIPQKIEKIPSKTNKNFYRELSKPKPKTQEFARGVRSEKNLIALSRSLAEISNAEKFPEILCQSKREKMHSSLENFIGIEPEINEDLITVAKTVKGAAKMKTLEEGMKKSFFDIQNFRSIFPIACVRKILPDQYTNLSEELSKSLEKSQVSSELEIVEKERKFVYDRAQIDPMIDEILNCADEVVQRKLNNQLLREAEEERSKRQDEIRRKVEEREEKALIERRIDEEYKKIADGVLDQVLTCAVEKISEEDSREFVMKIARKIDGKSLNFPEDEHETVEKLVTDYLLPEIERRIENHDEELHATAHDASEHNIESIASEEIHHAETISRDLLDEIRDKIDEV